MSGTPASSVAPWAALVVDDDAGVRQSLRLCLEAAGARVLGVATGGAAIEALERGAFDVLFLDLWLGRETGMDLIPELLARRSDLGVIVITALASFETAVEAIKRGAVDYLPKPFTPDQVRLAAGRVIEAQRLKRRLAELEQELGASAEPAIFETESPAFRRFLQTAARAAASDAVVLLRGESGTGKNVLARWIRANGPRAAAPFASVNCPDLAGDLMVSALFGHRRGAFTGAVADAAGKVQEAEGGTLFLDEVGDLTGEAQSRLLRFLNDRTYERLGDPRERRADVRLLAATNRPLEQDVRAGRFREDLFYRLDVLALTLPPLRERAEDILPLARHYLRIFSRAQRRPGLAFTPDAERALAAHRWPGNLRELRNAVERAVILGPRDRLEPGDFGLGLGFGLGLATDAVRAVAAGTDAAARSAAATAGGAAADTAGMHAGASAGPAIVGAPVSLTALEREHIARIIATSPSLDAAARTLGIDPTTLQRKRRRFGLA